MTFQNLRSNLVSVVFAASLLFSVGVASAVAQSDQSASQAAIGEVNDDQTFVAKPRYVRGMVTTIIEQQQIPSDQGVSYFTQRLMVRRSDTGQDFEVAVGSQFQPLTKDQLIKPGQQLILVEQIGADGTAELAIADVYRLPTIGWLLAIFILVVIVVGKWQGLLSVLGIGVNLAVLMGYILPQLVAGAQPLPTILAGGLLIAGATIYISHGFNTRSHIALTSILLVLGAVASLSHWAVEAANLSGLGSEEAYFLQFGSTAGINLRGLLLGGILLGALGVLDDIAVSQVSVVYQLKATKPKIRWTELYQRSIRVGKDHVASLVNTLVLAYAGANLPLFILFFMNEETPRWVTLNMDLIVEEVVRTMAGSIGLILAVPIATLIAATVASKVSWQKLEATISHGH